MATLSNPSLLTSFPLPASPGSSSSSSSQIRISPIHLPLSLKGKDPELLLTSPSGGGIWIYDLPTQAAVTNFAVGLGTKYAGNDGPQGLVGWWVPRKMAMRGEDLGLGMGEENKGKKGMVRRTVVAVESTTKGKGEVWIWDGEEVFEKREIEIEHPISSIHLIPSSNSLLITSPTSPSQITILTPSLQPLLLSLHPPASSSSILFKSILVSTYISPINVKMKTRECIFTYDTGHVLLFTITPTGEKENVEGEWTVGEERVVDVALDSGPELGGVGKGERLVKGLVDVEGGGLHLISSHGKIFPRALEITTSSHSGTRIIRPQTPPTPYTFRFIPSSPSTTAHIPTILIPTTTSSPSLLLTCLPSTIDTPCTLLLHHPSYPSILSILTLPRSLSEVSSLIPLTNDLIGLVGTTKDSKTDGEGYDGKVKGVVMTIEVGVGRRGVGIAQVMGSGGVTREWVKVLDGKDEQRDGGAGGNGVIGAGIERKTFLTAEEEAFLARFEATLKEGKEDDLNKAWTDFEMAYKPPTNREMNRPDTSKVIGKKMITLIFDSALGNSAASATANTTAGTTTAVNSLTDSITAVAVHNLTPIGTMRGAYSRTIVSALINKRWIVDSSYGSPSGGILCALARIGDWENILLGLKTFPNVSSGILVALLYVVLHPPSSTSSQALPTLQDFLKIYIRVPVSGQLHRVALAKGLKEVEEVCRLGEGLVAMLEEGAAGVGLELGSEEVVGLEERARDEELIIKHLTLVLDSHLDSLLSHPPAQVLLSRVQAWVKPAHQAQVELSMVKGVVEAFMRANKMGVEAESKSSSKQNGKGKDKGKGGRKGQGRVDEKIGGKKREFDGMYSLEEAVL